VHVFIQSKSFPSSERNWMAWSWQHSWTCFAPMAELVVRSFNFFEFISLILEALFHDTPIGLRVRAVGENGDDIDDCKKPFLLVRVPSAADLFFLKE